MQQKKIKTKNKISTRQIYIRYCIIPLLLFLFGVVMAIVYSLSKASPTILMYEHGMNEIISQKPSELLRGEKIQGEFISKENNLGIVALRFNTFFRINEDVVAFRIKEKGQKDWYYENSYTTPQFQPNQLFTFGFPVIADSLDKTYIFEVESTQGEPGNAVSLGSTFPVYVTKYQYAKELIRSNPEYAVTFLQRKVISTFSNVDFLLSFFVYLLPFFLYLIWLFLFERYLSNLYYLTLIPVFLMILTSFISELTNDSVILGIVGLWIAVSVAYRLKTICTFVFALGFLFISAILYYTPLEQLSVNLTAWTFMLLATGIILQIFEEVFSPLKGQRGFEVYLFWRRR